MDEKLLSPAQIDELGRAMQSLVYGNTEIRKLFQKKFGVTVTRADFYSELPTIEEIEASTMKPSLLKFDAIFSEKEFLISELENLYQASMEFNPPLKSDVQGVYSWENGQFGFSDAVAYYSMIRTRQPKTVVEIGSGWSTLVARQACQRNGFGRIVCVEPYPKAFLRNIPDIELIEKRIQDVETKTVASLLSDGDILFIDSTHTVKHDGDCLHIYLRLLPNLDTDTIVHVHDIYLPDARHIHHLLEHQTYWNEQYILYAYLVSNPKTKVIFGSWYHYLTNRERLEKLMHGRYRSGGNSLWFTQMAVPRRSC